MTYWTQHEMSMDYYLTNRIAAAAAQEGIPDADDWTYEQRRIWAAAPGWDEAWDSYLAANPEPPEQTFDMTGHPLEVNPTDEPEWIPPGKHEGVITDGMILSQVQAMGGGV